MVEDIWEELVVVVVGEVKSGEGGWRLKPTANF